MERAVDILIGLLAGLLVGLVTVVLGTLGSMGSTPPDAPSSCAGLTVAPLIVGAVCGGLVARRLARNRPTERRWQRRRR